MTTPRIMIVEDEKISAIDIQRNLEKLGYDVSATVASGAEALGQVIENRPDLVLMDIKLKGKIDGIQAAEIISKRFGIPFIYITAHSDNVTRQRAEKTNPAGYLIKPFQDTKLREILDKVLNPKPQVKKGLIGINLEHPTKPNAVRFPESSLPSVAF